MQNIFVRKLKELEEFLATLNPQYNQFMLITYFNCTRKGVIKWKLHNFIP